MGTHTGWDTPAILDCHIVQQFVIYSIFYKSENMVYLSVGGAEGKVSKELEVTESVRRLSLLVEKALRFVCNELYICRHVGRYSSRTSNLRDATRASWAAFELRRHGNYGY